MYGTHPLSNPINPCLLHAIARCLATINYVEVGHMSLPRIAATISTPLKQAMTITSRRKAIAVLAWHKW